MMIERERWSAAPASVRLAEDEAHVWCASLEQAPPQLKAFLDLLAPDERERAERFHFEKDRHHFIVARGVLRDILSRYLDCSPASVRFSFNVYGKPVLAGEYEHAGLRFNLSHSQGVALYALTRAGEVGVDIEFLRDDFASLEIAERYFSRTEVALLRTLRPELRTNGFFNCWTRKEAYIKALGEGLSHPLDRFAVSLAPGEPARFLSIDDDPQALTRWSLVELHPARGYAAALVLDGIKPALRCWEWMGQAGKN
jgi:4'-phosphopantetheinyl transferase